MRPRPTLSAARRRVWVVKWSVHCLMIVWARLNMSSTNLEAALEQRCPGPLVERHACDARGGGPLRCLPQLPRLHMRLHQRRVADPIQLETLCR